MKENVLSTSIKAGADKRSAPPTELRSRYFTAARDSILRGGASLAVYGLTPVVLAHVLEPRRYGVYATMTALAALVAGLFHLGQNAPLHKLLPQHFVNDRARGGALLADVVLLTLGGVLVCSALLFCNAGWIATRLYHDAALIDALRIGAGLMLAMTLFNLASSVVAGLQDFQSYNSALLVRSLTLAAASLIGVTVWGLPGAFIGQFIALGLGTAWLCRNAVPRARERFGALIRPDFSWPVLRSLGSFAAPVFLMTLCNLPGYWWANTLLAQTRGFAEVGRFSAAYGLAQLIWLVPVSFYVPALTFLAEAHAARRVDFGALVGSNIRAIGLLTLPLALGLALFSPWLLQTLFGTAYQQTHATAFALGLTGWLMGLTGLFNTTLAAADRLWHGCALALVWAVLFVGTGWLCIPRWGTAGVAVTYAVSNLCYCALSGLYLRARLHVCESGALGLIALTAAAFGTGWLLTRATQGALFYGAAALLCAAVTLVEWYWICRPTERHELFMSGNGLNQFFGRRCKPAREGGVNVSY